MTTQSGESSRLRAPRRLRQVLVATGVSSLGDGLVLVAFPLLALSRTSNPIAIVGVTVAGQIPSFLCALPAGALVDRVDRRRLAGFVNIARAGALGGFALVATLAGVSLWSIYLVIAILGTLQVVFVAISQVTLPALLAGEGLARANGKLAVAEIGGEHIVGPAIGGVLYGLSRFVPFVGDAISFVVSGALLQRALPGTPARLSAQGWRADMGEGLRWFLGQPALRFMAALVGSLCFFQSMVVSVLPLYAVHNLRLNHTGYGLLVATIAVGNVIGALGAGRALDRLGPATSLVITVVMGAGSYVILSATRSAFTAAAALIIEAVGISVCNVTTITVRQGTVPDHLLGRVTTVSRMTVLGLIPFGAIAGGITAANLGIPSTFLLAGSVELGIAVFLGPPTWRQLATVRPREG